MPPIGFRILLVFSLLSLAGCGVAPLSTSLNGSSGTVEEVEELAIPQVELDSDSLPARIKVVATFADRSELKAFNGQIVKAGTILVDKSLQRQRLQTRIDLLKEQIKSLQSERDYFFPDLPPSSVSEQEAKLDIALYDLQKHEEKMGQLPALDLPLDQELVMEHEKARLEKLEQQVKLERLKLEREIQAQAQREYEHNKSRELFEQKEREESSRRAYRLQELNAALMTAEDELSKLSSVVSPFDGTVSNIKWLSQNDQDLRVEISILLAESQSVPSLPSLEVSTDVPRIITIQGK